MTEENKPSENTELPELTRVTSEDHAASEAALEDDLDIKSETRKLSTFATTALVLVLIVLAVMAWQWYASRQHFLSLESELSEKIEQFNQINQQSLALAKNADERSTSANAHSALLDQKLAESQDQLQALQTLYTELANNREERLISEVEQLLIIANQQLQIAGNIKPALLALQTADSRLQQLETPQATQLRKALAQDIQHLQNLPTVDIVGMSLKLENLSNSIDSLPLLSERHPESKNTPVPDWDSNPWHRLAQEIWSDLKRMIRIERVDRPEPPLLAPDQRYFLRENIRLRLLTARIALLQHDEATYRADLQAASDWITKHFDLRENSTRNALGSLKELSSSEIVIDIPDITESLGLVSKYKLVLERTNSAKSSERSK